MSEPRDWLINVNRRPRRVEAEPGTPLLWVLRDGLALKGAKFGCGVGICGACTIIIDGEAQRSCTIAIEAVGDAQIETIEGLAERAPDHPLFRAWESRNVSQCGYCQPGQIMTALALLNSGSTIDETTIKGAMAANLCRCGSYPRIVAAVLEAAEAAR